MNISDCKFGNDKSGYFTVDELSAKLKGIQFESRSPLEKSRIGHIIKLAEEKAAFLQKDDLKPLRTEIIRDFENACKSAFKFLKAQKSLAIIAIIGIAALTKLNTNSES